MKMKLSLLISIILLVTYIKADTTSQTQYSPSVLDQLDADICNNPPRIRKNISARKAAFGKVDQLLKTMSHREWKSYMQYFDELFADSESNRQQAERKIEGIEKNGLPYFLRKRLTRAVARIKRNNVPEGKTVITYLYNHGFVIQTGQTTLGIDLAGPHVEKLAEVLDALVVSHWHADHFSASLVVEMCKAGRPVFFRSYNGSPAIVRQSGYPGKMIDPHDGGNASVGTSQLIFFHGDHYPASFVKYNSRITISQDSVLDTLIITDQRKGKPSLTIFHDGDDFNKISKLSAVKDKDIDVFLGHGVPSPEHWKDMTKRDAKKWFELNDSIGDPFGTAKRINARLFIAGHQGERGHPDCIGGCTPFKDALEFVDCLPGRRGLVMFWGEKIEISPRELKNEANLNSHSEDPGQRF